jgi:hypothetical protein
MITLMQVTLFMEKRKAGRPKNSVKNKNVTIRLPKNLIIIADHMGLKWRETLVEQFEKMVCVSALVKRGGDCNICEDTIKRKQVIEFEYQQALDQLQAEERAKAEEQARDMEIYRIAARMIVRYSSLSPRGTLIEMFTSDPTEFTIVESRVAEKLGIPLVGFNLLEVLKRCKKAGIE